MSRLKDLAAGCKPVHQRHLEFKSCPLGEDRVLVEGWLRDDRLTTAYQWDGSVTEPGVIHWMGIRMIVEGHPLTITDIEAEMPGVPHERCPETIEAVKRLTGLAITAGYSREVARLTGGVAGCSHLTHLAIAMGPAALHGYWAEKARVRRSPPTSLDEMPGLSQLLNSCLLWRDGGPLMEKVKQVIEQGKKP